MKVKVAKWGNSVAVRLPKAAAEALHAVPGTELELTVEGGRAHLSAPSRVRRIDLEDLVAEARRLGPQNEPKFEDWGILPSEWPDEDWSDIAPKDDEP
ncbi:AbrB/MazE/SpoVT family DNA-binding domain-containing protein [Xanthobacter pseudotagetidis]|uniref:AbrB/MazE/SpoVT family DNA-binding domain-containing protein n=1 Tax=Xanthobacter pseudotagetidis TaxID=3119911 RepID=UPI003728E75F